MPAARSINPPKYCLCQAHLRHFSDLLCSNFPPPKNGAIPLSKHLEVTHISGRLEAPAVNLYLGSAIIQAPSLHLMGSECVYYNYSHHPQPSWPREMLEVVISHCPEEFQHCRRRREKSRTDTQLQRH